MKRFVAPFLLAATLLTGCSGAGQSSSSAVPSAAPTKAKVVTPALATSREPLATEEDPMNQYHLSQLTAEDKVAQLRLYKVISEALNYYSWVNPEPVSAYKKLYEEGDITKAMYDDNATAKTEWTPQELDKRNVGYSEQVTGIYCPMRAQTQSALEMGSGECWFTASTFQDGDVVTRSGWDDVTGGLAYYEPDKLRSVRFEVKEEQGIYKVDGLRFSS